MNNKKLIIYVVAIIILLILFVLKNFKFVLQDDIVDIKKKLVSKNIETVQIKRELEGFKKLDIHMISSKVLTLSKQNDLKLLRMYKQEEYLKLNVEGNYAKIANFLIELEDRLKHFKLHFVSLLENRAEVSISFTNKNLGNVKDKSVKEVLYPFENKKYFVSKKNSKEIKKELSLKLEAIVDSSVKINGKWYRLFANVHGWRVVHIAQSYVLLKHIQTKKFKKLLF